MPHVGPVSQQDAINMIANYIQGVETGAVGQKIGRGGTVKVGGAAETVTIKDCLEAARQSFLEQTTEIVDKTTRPTVPNPPIALKYGVMPFDPLDPPLVMRYGVLPRVEDTTGGIGDVVALYAVRPGPMPPSEEKAQLGYLRRVLQGGAKQVDAIFGSAIETMQKAIKGGHLTKDEVTAMKLVVDGYQAARDLVDGMLVLHEQMAE